MGRGKLATLPPELLELIAHALCIDDGSAIRAFSAVCRDFRHISSPHLYSTIFLEQSSKQHHGRATKLCKQLFKSIKERRTIYRVYHVYLHLAHVSKGGRRSSDWLAALRILGYAANHIRTLTIVIPPVSGPRTKANIFLVSFCKGIPCPQLTDLTIRGTFYLPRIHTPKNNFPQADSSFISSTVRIRSCSLCSLRNASIPSFPIVTHLRISGIDPEDFLPMAFNNSTLRLQDKTVQGVSMHFGYLPSSTKHAVASLKRSADECRALQLPLVIETMKPAELTMSQVKLASLDRMNGGDGWWGIDDFKSVRKRMHNSTIKDDLMHFSGLHRPRKRKLP
ncbi:hypothetical protein DL96DRAFT_1715192 [Flagelloscypha sp. PMI_526]|nr:hypothetical protein DL96DRAFT_1715192 [Flagelloscypha sp. PMI_526]